MTEETAIPTDSGDSGISVVIPTYCRATSLSRIVQPFLDDRSVKEVLIVDDGSTDDTPAVCRQLAKESTKVRPLRQANGGEAAARRAGALHATQDVVLFVDDDVVAGADLGRRHLIHHTTSSEPIVVLGYMPILLPPNRTKGQFPLYIYDSDYERTCQEYAMDGKIVLEKLWGGNLSVRRDIFLQTATIPKSLAYHQDQVLGRYLRERGCTGVFDRTLVATHRYERTPDQFFQDGIRRGQALADLASINSFTAETSPIESAPCLARPFLKALSRRQNLRLRRFLLRLISGCGIFHFWTLETAISKFLRHIDAQVSYSSRRSSNP